MEIKEPKTAKRPAKLIVRVKDIQKDLIDKLGAALADHKTVLGEDKMNKQVKKFSKALAKEIAKSANRKVKSKKK